MKNSIKFIALSLACLFVLAAIGCTPKAPATEPATKVEETKGTPTNEPAQTNNGLVGVHVGHNSGLTTRTAAEGYYVQYLNSEDLGEAIFGPMNHEGNDVACFQINSLVLTNNTFASRGNCTFAYEPGQRYEFTKDFRDTQRGMHFIFCFYGTYTVDGNKVTLSKPETFSYNLWTGDGGPIAEPTDAGGWCTDPETDKYVNAMNTAIMNYRCAYGHEEMTVTIDQTNFTFTVDEVSED